MIFIHQNQKLVGMFNYRYIFIKREIQTNIYSANNLLHIVIRCFYMIINVSLKSFRIKITLSAYIQHIFNNQMVICICPRVTRHTCTPCSMLGQVSLEW